MADFVLFNEFIDRTASARVEHHLPTLRASLQRAAAGGARAAVVKDDFAEEEFDKMKQYILDIYKGAQSAHTFLDASGNAVDCIPFGQQATLREAKKAGHKPPAKPPLPPGRGARGKSGQGTFGPAPGRIIPPLRQGLSDPFGNPMACPEGYVPIRRTTLSQLTWRGTFENFFRKAPAPESAKSDKKTARAKSAKSSVRKGTRRGKSVPPQIFGGGGEVHRHAVCQTTSQGQYTACSVWMNLWNVNPAPGVFSLAQLWLRGSISGKIQTIESGWQVYPAQWHTSAPALFVYYNPAGYDPQISGYFQNPRGEGFVRYSSNWPLGSALPGPFSTRSGPQYAIQMGWALDGSGNWWLYLDDDFSGLEPVGYFPAGLYQGDLATGAADVQFGGEVAAQPPSQSTGPMGSGIRPFGDPSTNYGQAAFLARVSLQEKGGAVAPADLFEVNTGDSDSYLAARGSSEQWGTFLFFGGAGAS